MWICVLYINRNSFPPGMGFILCMENQGSAPDSRMYWSSILRMPESHKIRLAGVLAPAQMGAASGLCPCSSAALRVPPSEHTATSWTTTGHVSVVRGAQRRAVLSSFFGRVDSQFPFSSRGITESEDACGSSTLPSGNGLSRQFSTHSLKNQILWFCFGWEKTDAGVCQGQRD